MENLNESINELQNQLVPLVQKMYENDELSFTSIFYTADEGENFWRPKENICGKYLYEYYDNDSDWVVDISKQTAEDYKKVINEAVKEGIVKLENFEIEKSKQWLFESLDNWSKSLLASNLISNDVVEKIKSDFETIISTEGASFFSLAHGNIIGDHIFIDENNKIYLLGMRIVSRPGNGYYDLLRSLDWLILKTSNDEEKFEKTIDYMKKYLLDFDWEQIKLVFAFRCIGILGWDILYRGDIGTGDLKKKKEILLRFINREY